ncbi:hypothetical protein [Aliarcobacter butzleri]|uniref:Uncharacterized protein n=2 Tax=Aliarcobacter butzleri TaxID=28197 RepID=A0AAP4PZI6_9BACT|nr:hypothetical protein [Aliarcobacter butzleri]MCT7575609.1 hypothetical protein [Aliarcobacter butzleri]MDN5052532.1 hypothetical protein [Aliarcobacter butzleri]MDN5075982.1 hypothetical protein [Aliarcobacter butzleri]MDN5116744.1 hypothetical protein [Aliarcobacter butzleri]MDN5131050.1 hypothetical protein [Aliarcobacter butzleri]
MKQKTINSEVFTMNTSSLSKTQKNIYNEIYQKYRLSEIYEFLKLIYKYKVNFSDIFMKDLFTILIKTGEYTSKVESVYYYTYFPKDDDMSQIQAITLNSAACKILKAIMLNKPVLNKCELEKLMFTSLIIFLDQSFYYSRFRYPRVLNKYICDSSINKYINEIKDESNDFKFIMNLINAELKNEAEILERNPKLLRLLNNNE